MPFDCRVRTALGHEFCYSDCPVAAADGTFSYVRVERAEDVPPPSATIVDLAVLDMHHGWPNLGHDAIIHAMQNAVCDVHDELRSAGLAMRVLSYDVRRGLQVPEAPGDRHLLYVGTGGPGHLDPRMNDGSYEGSQGIREDPAWEARAFALFDRIRADRRAALLGVCHTFGVICRWLSAAAPVLRGPGKGGKSAGIVENVLADEAKGHPWFSAFAAALPDHRHFRVLDNRLYDLVPPASGLPPGVQPIAWEATGAGGPQGDALTMLEVDREPGAHVPRMLAVNHHPEIINRGRQAVVLRKQLERGNVTAEWYDERMRTLTEPISDEWGDRLLHLASSYTFLAPLRFHIYRLARERGEALGRATGIDERSLPIAYSLESEPTPAPR